MSPRRVRVDSVANPLDRSTTWPYDDAGEPGRFSYARAEHPNQVAVEAVLGRLEGGRALLYPAGMGAVTGVVLTMLPPGGTIALAAGAYYGHKQLFDHLSPWGIRAVEYDQTGPPPEEADLILIEAPANPLLTMPSFEAAVAHPAPVVCDSTLGSPLRVRPLELGCDVALHSATKVLGGHDDLLAGVASVKDDDLYDRLHLTRRLAGIVASADTAWLLERGLRTFEVRFERMEASARVLAERLLAHPAVTVARYPGFGFLISFDVADGAAARRVEVATELIENATSLGGTRTKLESRHRWEGDRCPAGLLRLSVGLDPVEELWADLERALAAA
jgi:cystathionine gamma-synthase